MRQSLLQLSVSFPETEWFPLVLLFLLLCWFLKVCSLPFVFTYAELTFMVLSILPFAFSHQSSGSRQSLSLSSSVPWSVCPADPLHCRQHRSFPAVNRAVLGVSAAWDTSRSGRVGLRWAPLSAADLSAANCCRQVPTSPTGWLFTLSPHHLRVMWNFVNFSSPHCSDFRLLKAI